MGAKYTTIAASGYNSSPPPDDGSQSASNLVSWATHKTKLTDPLKTEIDAINTALVSAFDYSVRQITANDNTVAGDHMRTVEIAPTVTTAVTVSLGDATTMTNIYRVFVKNSSAINQTVGRVTSGDTVDGTAANVVIRPGESILFGVINAASGYVTLGRTGTYGGAIASGRNIAARTNSGTPNTKLDITADQIGLEDANGNVFKARSVSVTIDFGTTGANGLDSGAQALSTWYYGWVIAKPDGTIAGLGSTSSSAPTMPTGYTFKALVTAARSDGSTHFLKYRQFGNEVFYEAEISALSAGSATAETTVSVAGSVPPNAQSFRVDLSPVITADGSGNVYYTIDLRFISGTSQSSQQLRTGGLANNGLVWAPRFQLEIPNVSQQFFYLWTVNNGASQALDALVIGFKLPLGGE